MHVGQSVQAKDVALLPVLIYLSECQLCSTLCLRIFTRACLHAGVLHWCTADVRAPQCQQQRQQHAALHDKNPEMAFYNTHRQTHTPTLPNRLVERCTERFGMIFISSSCLLNTPTQPLSHDTRIPSGKHNHCPHGSIWEDTSLILTANQLKPISYCRDLHNRAAVQDNKLSTDYIGKKKT